MGDFRERLTSKRKELSLTMEDLAKKIGVTKATIQKYENGEIKNIPLRNVTKLANALNTTENYLMGWETNNNKEQQKDNKVIAALLSAGIDINKLTKEEIDKMIDYAKFILQNKK